MSYPVLKKARAVRGKSLVLRDATINDARFILALRTDTRISKHLSHVSSALEDQIAWLRCYAQSSDQAYFVIELTEGKPIGIVRLYDPHEYSFCWGSWIMSRDAPPAAAIESALLVYAYGLHTLGFRCAHFQVRRGNTRVWAFHERFGAVRTGESALEFEYEITREAILRSMDRYRRYLPKLPTVEGLD
jgi:RimJ/RimL family protein N-acetyltransferase